MFQFLEILAESSSRRMWRFLGIYLVFLFGLHLTSFVAYLLIPLALAAAARKRILLCIYLLIIIPCLNVMNNVFFIKDVNYVISSKSASLLLCGIMVFQGLGVQERQGALKPFAWLVGYAAFMIATSPLSLVPVISLAKGMFFTTFILSLVQATRIAGKRGVHAAEIRSIFLAIAVFFIVGSAVTIFFPAVGQSMMYSRLPFVSDNMDGFYGHFNGVTFHSQSLGPALAMLNGFLLADYVFNVRRSGRLHLLLLAIIPVLIYHTSSRTAMFAYIASCLIVMAYMANARRVAAGRKGMIYTAATILAVVALVTAIVGGTLRESALAFMVKDVARIEGRNVDVGGFTERVTSSRAYFIRDQISHFKKRPLLGMGFQVSEEMKEESDLRGALRFLSAPIEKGFAPTMILEEGGVFGAVIFLCFLVSAFATYTRLRCYCFLSTFSTFLITNCGEATLFSPSSIGGFGWLLCFGAMMLDLWLVEGRGVLMSQPGMAVSHRTTETCSKLTGH